MLNEVASRRLEFRGGARFAGHGLNHHIRIDRSLLMISLSWADMYSCIYLDRLGAAPPLNFNLLGSPKLVGFTLFDVVYGL